MHGRHLVPDLPLRDRGFTLIELMTVISLLAILLALAAPAFQQLVAAQRMRTASYDLVSDLTLARSEALKRSASVQVTPSGGNWLAGWTVQTMAGAQTLGQRSPLGDSLLTVTTTPPSLSSVTFDLNGRVANAASSIRIGLSDGAGRHRCISLDPSGRPKAMAVACP